MRYVAGLAVILSLLWTSDAGARIRCGDDPADLTAVASAEAAVALQCSCCALHHGYATCVAALLRAAHRAQVLPGRCATKVRRDVAHACPLVAPSSVCTTCDADSDCPAGAFCECRRGSCTKTAGVCTVRPEVCTDTVAPVCGCDGTTYGNDCLRRHAGVCKLHAGACVASGGCFDTIAGACTGAICSPGNGCPLPNEFCSPACASPPPTGTCFDTLARQCTKEACGPDRPCLPNEFCVPTCPPPPPAGACFVTVDMQCSSETCGPGAPCRNPNEFCDPQCLGPTCTSDADCDDGNGCTVDRCTNGVCEHDCVCLTPAGGSSCCPGPATFCANPCGFSADGTCGGVCPIDEVCTLTDDGCSCVAKARACGDAFPTCDGSCPVGSACASVSVGDGCACVPTICVNCPTPTITPILDPTPPLPTQAPTETPTPTPTVLPPGTYGNGGGICRWTLDCPILPFAAGGNLWPYAPNATSGTFANGWIQWSLGAYPTAAVNTCTPFTGTSTYPQLPSPRMQGTTYAFTLQGSCSGIDSDGKAYTLTTTQSLETYYSRGGGGKGGGGAGWKVRDTGGTTTISYP